ncbi:hypothetical protein EK904_007308 [Melospiza melodia maxima]|nr:hypothetical protein EK904_007308 [Melospiza melodia maxima]
MNECRCSSDAGCTHCLSPAKRHLIISKPPVTKLNNINPNPELRNDTAGNIASKDSKRKSSEIIIIIIISISSTPWQCCSAQAVQCRIKCLSVEGGFRLRKTSKCYILTDNSKIVHFDIDEDGHHEISTKDSQSHEDIAWLSVFTRNEAPEKEKYNNDYILQSPGKISDFELKHESAQRQEQGLIPPAQQVPGSCAQSHCPVISVQLQQPLGCDVDYMACGSAGGVLETTGRFSSPLEPQA